MDLLSICTFKYSHYFPGEGQGEVHAMGISEFQQDI